MAIRAISGHFPDLLIACDVCLCPYTDHGHCGIFKPDGFIDNEKSIAQLAAISKKFVEAGAHVIAPSGTLYTFMHARKMTQNVPNDRFSRTKGKGGDEELLTNFDLRTLE